MSSVDASPAKTTKFTFPKLVTLLPADFTTIDLSATIAASPDGPSSDLSIFGSEQVDDADTRS